MIIAAVLFATVLTASVAVPADGDSDGCLLIDYGNGQTVFLELVPGGTYAYAMGEAASEAGIECGFSDGISVDGSESADIAWVHTSWRFYTWQGSEWVDSTSSFDPDEVYDGGSVALGFYPEGTVPVATPEYRSVWTMVRGDSANSGVQTSVVPDSDGYKAWSHTYGRNNYVNAATLVEGRHVYVVAGGGYTATDSDPALYCYDRFTGEEVWRFEYPKGAGYETATGAIVGDYYYLPATNGHLYRIPLSGPGEDGSEVISLEIARSPSEDHPLTGMAYSTGPATVIHDSGVLYFGTSGGYVYCTDLDLNVIWRTAIDGRVYGLPVTVHDGVVFAGALNGCLYAFDRVTGEMLDSVEVYTIEMTSGGTQRTYGSVNPPVMVGDILMFSFSDGRGMNSASGGIAGYRFTDSGFEEVFRNTDVGLSSTMVQAVDSGSFEGVYFTNLKGVCRVSVDGTYEVLTTGLGAFRGPLTLVNGEFMYVMQYDKGGRLYMIDLDGNVLASLVQPSEVAQFCMTPVVVIDGSLYCGTDGGAFSWVGALPGASGAGSGDASSVPWSIIAVAVLIIIVIVFAVVLLRRAYEKGMPFMAFIRSSLKTESAGGSKVRRNKRRLLIVIIVGLAAGFLLFLLSLSWGPSGSYSLGETFSIFVSALEKTVTGGELTMDEIFVFDSRCARAVAAFAAGVGLSISGSVYQAIIRNPMVDPYIMGVSAGAGVAAVATIAFDFTLFGLLDNVTYITPVVAMIGGLVAFGMTMLLAEKAGGSSVNYVLAGVIVGLVFSAIQTLMLSMAGDKLQDSMSWLFGSFANINWQEAIIMFVPAIALSFVPMIWAKEFNLVLLGEDQARQMGLDVRRFNRWMLILASVLASLCVAFVGIIGFVGLVVPHLCRMVLGGDHRLVMPASMVVGGALMLAADLFAKMVLVPMELPVGAITTVIGAPVFAYLLIRRGRMYDG